ncbi:MAG: cell division protein ZapB [Treponema sp.]|jgi:FtsZ-binding cell division protein ZapB|nr:cell division protein ZapB [Treponema sp.]
MINLEQVKLLESRVAKAVDYIDRLAKENAVLRQKETETRDKLAATQKRINELEGLVTGFKEEQGRIEESILAALDRLSQFEKAVEKSLKEKPTAVKPPKAAPVKTVAEQTVQKEGGGDAQTCFEIPEGAADDDDIPDPLSDSSGSSTAMDGGELDIF